MGRLLSVYAADSAGADGAEDRRAVGFDLHQERRRIKAGDFSKKERTRYARPQTVEKGLFSPRRGGE